MLKKIVLVVLTVMCSGFAARADDDCVEKVIFYDGGMILEASSGGSMIEIPELGASFRQYFIEDVKERKQKGLAENGMVIYFDQKSNLWEKTTGASVGAGGTQLEDGVLALTPDLLKKFPMKTRLFSEAFPGKTLVVGDTASVDPGKESYATVWRDDERDSIGSRAGNLCRKDVKKK